MDWVDLWSDLIYKRGKLCFPTCLGNACCLVSAATLAPPAAMDLAFCVPSCSHPPCIYLITVFIPLQLTPRQATPSQSRSSQKCWLRRTSLVQKFSPGHSCSQHCVTSFLCSRDLRFTNVHNTQIYLPELQNIWADTTTSFHEGCRKKGCNFLSEPQLHQKTGGFTWGKHNT